MLKRILISTALIVLTLFFGSAEATYNKTCMEALTMTVPQAKAFQLARAAWEINFPRLLGVTRPLTNLEFEVVMDVMHELPLKAKFANGQEIRFSGGQDDSQKLKRLFGSSGLVEVGYLGDARKKLGTVLKQACEALGRTNCEVYNTYAGLISTASRPLTPIQEQAVKWSTIHMAPGNHMLDTYRRMGATLETVRIITANVSREKKDLALQLIVAAFGEEEGQNLHAEFIAPYISAAFERIPSLLSGSRPN